MARTTDNIITGFLSSVERFPERPALYTAGREYTYRELYAFSCSVAAAIHERSEAEGPVAVFANRNLTACAGILGALLAGRPYLPINPTFPPPRVRHMIEKTRCRAVVAEPGSLDLLAAALGPADGPCLVIFPEEDPGDALPGGATVLGKKDLPRVGAWTPPPAGPGDLAYIMFTSGSTGTPKGVMTTHANIRWVVDVLQERYRLTETDRLSLNADLTFSASVLSLFLAFECGAAVCCPTRTELLNPGRFIQAQRLTLWKAVPSLYMLMDRLHQLKDGAFPTVRLTTFGGEPIPADLVQLWCRAAPRSVIEAVYGSTELSVNALYYRWDPVHSLRESDRGIVPLGYALPGAEYLVCDESLKQVATGGEGELLFAGPLLTAGYAGDEELTRGAYVTPPGETRLFYRTGDIVRRPAQGKPLTIVGRKDNQIKVLGNRVELGEVEFIARKALGTLDIVALGWPPSARGFDGIVMFAGGTELTQEEVMRRLREALPPYMVPREVRLMQKLPLNPSGKRDRLALRSTLENEQNENR
ncbi:MAG: AMP-binding protein [Bacteroidota bacterium]